MWENRAMQGCAVYVGVLWFLSRQKHWKDCMNNIMNSAFFNDKYSLALNSKTQVISIHSNVNDFFKVYFNIHVIYLFLKEYTPIGNLWVGNETNYHRKSPLCLAHTYKICHFPRAKNMGMLHQERKMFLEVFMYFLLVCHAKMYEIYTGYISRVVDIWWMFIRYSQCVRYGDLRRAPRSFTHLLLITLSQMRGRSKMSIIYFKFSHHYFLLKSLIELHCIFNLPLLFGF